MTVEARARAAARAPAHNEFASSPDERQAFVTAEWRAWRRQFEEGQRPSFADQLAKLRELGEEFDRMEAIRSAPEAVDVS